MQQTTETTRVQGRIKRLMGYHDGTLTDGVVSTTCGETTDADQLLTAVGHQDDDCALCFPTSFGKPVNPYGHLGPVGTQPQSKTQGYVFRDNHQTTIIDAHQAKTSLGNVTLAAGILALAQATTADQLPMRIYTTASGRSICGQQATADEQAVARLLESGQFMIHPEPSHIQNVLTKLQNRDDQAAKKNAKKAQQIAKKQAKKEKQISSQFMGPRQVLAELTRITLEEDAWFRVTRGVARGLTELAAPVDLVVAWLLTGFTAAQLTSIEKKVQPRALDLSDDLFAWRDGDEPETAHEDIVRRCKLLGSTRILLKHNEPIKNSHERLTAQICQRGRLAQEYPDWLLPLEKNLLAAFKDIEGQLPP
jgi:hypothetical protein